MHLETLDSPNCGRLFLHIMNSEFKRKFQVTETTQEKKGLPMLIGRHIAFMIYAVVKINDVHGPAIGTNDLLNIELRKDSLKMFDETWEGTLMAKAIEPDMAFLEGPHCRHLEQSTIMKNILALYPYGLVHRKEPKR